MEELLRKLAELKKDEIIKKHCGNRVFMNNKNTQVQMPYISYNPTITGKAIGHYNIGLTEHLMDRYTSQINFYCDTGYNFIEVYNAIRNVMSVQGFQADTEFVDSTDNGIWICFRFKVRI